MAVGGVVGGRERTDVDVDHAGRVRAVDEHVHAARLELAHQLGDREHQRRLARHVIEHREPRARRDAREHRFDHRLGARDRERHLRHDDAAAALGGDVLEDVARGVVLVVGHEEL